jgi:hypothetical protein
MHLGLVPPTENLEKLSEFWQNFLASVISTFYFYFVPFKNFDKIFSEFCHLVAPKTS